MKLGTVLISQEDRAKADRHADKQKQIALATAAVELAGMEKRTVGGEIRYYLTDTIYTPAVPNGKRRWFETRHDGDYSIDNPIGG